MPLDLTDAELATAAQACRAIAYQEGCPREEARESYDARPDRERGEAAAVAGRWLRQDFVFE
jgi:hypothetical protein